jgi:RNA 3'-terminal phosphate cyclase (ATP)
VNTGGQAASGTRQLVPLDLLERGEITGRLARSIVARLAERIAERELALVSHKLNWPAECLKAETANDSAGPGNAIMIEIASEQVTEVFTGFGSVERSSEEVAGEAVDEARRYLAAGVPVGVHLADQLLIPLALAGGRFRTLAPSRHTTTNIDVIKRFCQVDIACEKIDRDVWEVRAQKET